VLRREALLPLLVLVLFLILWEGFCRLLHPPAYLIPSPLAIILRATSLGDKIFVDVATTAAESLMGFVLGSILGIVLGVLFASYRAVELSLMPYAIALKTVPIVALAPLLVIWFGFGMSAKVVLAALICFFPVLVSTAQGLKDIDQRSVDLFRSLAASPVQIFIWLRWPSALGHLFASFRVAIVFSVIGAIVAEFAGAKQGLGFRILVASYNVDTVTMFVYIILSAFLGMAFYGIVAFLEGLLVPWRKQA